MKKIQFNYLTKASQVNISGGVINPHTPSIPAELLNNKQPELMNYETLLRAEIVYDHITWSAIDLNW